MSDFNDRATALADKVSELLNAPESKGLEFEALKIAMYRRGYVGMVWLDVGEIECVKDQFDDLPPLPDGAPIDQLTWATHALPAYDMPVEWWAASLQQVYENVNWPDSVSEWLNELRLELWIQGALSLRDEGGVQP